MTHAIPFSDREIEVPGGALRIRFAENDKREPNNDYDVSPRQPILNLAGDAGDVCVRTFSYTIHILARKRADPHYAFYHNFATGQKKKVFICKSRSLYFWRRRTPNSACAHTEWGYTCAILH